MAAPYFRLDQKFEYPCHPILPLLEFLWKRSLAMFQGWSWPIQLETKPEEVLKLKAKREAILRLTKLTEENIDRQLTGSDFTLKLIRAEHFVVHSLLFFRPFNGSNFWICRVFVEHQRG